MRHEKYKGVLANIFFPQACVGGVKRVGSGRPNLITLYIGPTKSNYSLDLFGSV